MYCTFHVPQVAEIHGWADGLMCEALKWLRAKVQAHEDAQRRFDSIVMELSAVDYTDRRHIRVILTLRDFFFHMTADVSWRFFTWKTSRNRGARNAPSARPHCASTRRRPPIDGCVTRAARRHNQTPGKAVKQPGQTPTRLELFLRLFQSIIKMWPFLACIGRFCKIRFDMDKNVLGTYTLHPQDADKFSSCDFSTRESATAGSVLWCIIFNDHAPMILWS